MTLNNVVMQQRRDTAEAWRTANPVLAAGQIGIEKDTTFMKIGDGTTPWRLLPYASVPMISVEEIDALFADIKGE